MVYRKHQGPTGSPTLADCPLQDCLADPFLADMLPIPGHVQAQGTRMGHACILHKQPVLFRSQTPAFQRKFFRSPDAHMQSKLVAAAAAADEAIETTAEPAGASDDLRVTDLKIGVAHVYNLRGSPDKFRRVIDKIRGRSYADALYNLTRLPYKAVEDITEVLKSAANNAANNSGASKSDLIISECFVDGAGHYKRFQPRAKGRPGKIQIKKSHMTVKVTEVPQSIRQRLISSAKRKKK